MTPLEPFLAPVSADQPCGPDLSYDQAFLDLDTLVAGKPETQFSPAEPPDWKEVRKACTGLLARFKHLRLAITFTAAQLRLDGLAGFRDGLIVLKAFVDQFWPALYPPLDPEDNNDPTERINIIASLTMPIGSMGDPLRFLQALRATPISQSMQMGRYSLADIAASQAGTPSTPDKPVPTAAQLDASFRDTKPELIVAWNDVVTETITLVTGLAESLSAAVGSHRAPDLDPLLAVLKEIRKHLTPFLPAMETPAQELSVEDFLGETAAAPAPVATARPAAAIGGIHSRDDVERTLDLICKYYAQNEPSSPVPLLLQRARRLVKLDFLGILEDLTPEAVAQINALAGVKP